MRWQQHSATNRDFWHSAKYKKSCTYCCGCRCSKRSVYAWVVWNIPPNSTSLSRNETLQFPQGLTSAGTNGYKGPCPPFGVHRYFFTLYALDTVLNLDSSTTRSGLEQAIVGHIINKTILMGTYSRN